LGISAFPTSMVLSSYQEAISTQGGAPGPELFQWDGMSVNLKGNFTYHNQIWNFNGMAVGADGLLYALGQWHNETQWNIYRFNRTTGKLHEPVFIPFVLPYRNFPPEDFAFGSNGNIFVSIGNNIEQFNSETGQPMGLVTSIGGFFGGLVSSNSDGLLYATYNGYDQPSGGIQSINLTTFESNRFAVGNFNYFCQDSNGYIYLPNITIYQDCDTSAGAILRYRPNIDPHPVPFISTGTGTVPYSCQVGIGSMNDTLIVADPCHDQLSLYNLETGQFKGVASLPESPGRFINWNDVA